MIKKIIFIGDHYRGDQDKNVKILFGLISPVFFNTHIEVEILSNTDKYANQEKWIESLKGKGISALKNYDLNDVAIIGFEINQIDKLFLTNNGIPWINIEIHPIRFLEDLYFSVTSSFEFNNSKMSVSDNNIKLAANSIKLNNLNSALNIKENSLLIVGQTPKDKSVFFDGKFKSLDDYLVKLDYLCENHENIYYKPHPYLTSPEVDSRIIDRYNAALITDENYYNIISQDNLKTVCAISSSCLYEARYFDKKVVFLEDRQKEYEKPVKLKKILENSELWFEKLCSIQSPVNKCTDFAFRDNFCRTYYGSWSYEIPIVKLQTQLALIEARVSQAEEEATQAEQRATQAEQRATEAEAKATQAEQEAYNAWHHYHLVVNSNSWKLTYPLREARRGIKWFTTGVYHWITFSPTSRPRRVTKKVLLKLKNHIEHRPKLKREIVSLLNRFPLLKKKLKNFLGFEVPVENNRLSTTISTIEDCQQLSPQAQTIYKKLKEEIQRQRGKK